MATVFHSSSGSLETQFARIGESVDVAGFDYVMIALEFWIGACLVSVGILNDVRDGIDVHLAPLSVAQYERMIQDGILREGACIELICGSLIYKDRRDESGGDTTHGPRHLRSLNKLVALLSQWVASRSAFLQVQGPIVVSDTSEPEPDCCLVRGTPDDYANRVPQAADLLAVFEVAYSSLQSDRRTKQRLYASAGIPVLRQTKCAA